MTFADPGSRIVVTGATGFVGQALVAQLAASGYDVIGISDRQEPQPATAHLLREYYCVDLTRQWPDIAPFTGLIHLAGLAAVQPSFEQPQRYLNVNSTMITNFFEYALSTGWLGRAIIVSSGAVYGTVNQLNRGGFDECSVLAPTSPYVVSKMLVENQVDYYRRQGVDALVVRPFNHIGPRQGPGFLVPDLVRKVTDAQQGEEVTVGNLNTSRDYTDVRDIVCAYVLLLEHRNPFHITYNVCSGSAHSGWEILGAVCNALEISIPPVKAVSDRAIDPGVIIGNAERLRSEVGWRPAICLQQSIRDFVAETWADD